MILAIGLYLRPYFTMKCENWADFRLQKKQTAPAMSAEPFFSRGKSNSYCKLILEI